MELKQQIEHEKKWENINLKSLALKTENMYFSFLFSFEHSGSIVHILDPSNMCRMIRLKNSIHIQKMRSSTLPSQHVFCVLI